MKHNFFCLISCFLLIVFTITYGEDCENNVFDPQYFGIESIETKEDILSENSFHPIFSYTSQRGIGNNSGYSTLQLIYTPDYVLPGFQAFADLRGHAFDQGQFAANAGAGIRYFQPEEDAVMGANLYYDFRNTDRFAQKDYHQIGAGFEFLCCYWDFRGNAYYPIGSRKSHSRHRKQFNFCLAGGDFEIGTSLTRWFCRGRYVDLYAAAGPYYYKGDFKEGLAGGRFRLALFLNAFISFEGRVTYDHVFKTRGQGIVRIEIPLSHIYDFFCYFTIGDYSSDCLHRKMASAPFRNEIIPIREFN